MNNQTTMLITMLIIGEVAARAGVRVETVRFYEREGLLSKAKRAANGYRSFPPDAIDRIRLIQRAKELGFSLEEIGDLLKLKANRGNRASSVRIKAQAKLADIDRKIETLQRMKEALLPLVHACHPDKPIDDCPILNALQQQPDDNNR
jgi:MerR family mercuric resistance operon transcriptional regulator